MKPLVVPQDMVDRYFPLAAPHLKKAIDHNPYTTWDLPSLHQACAIRTAYLFVDGPQVENALTGQFIPYHAGMAFYIMFWGGEGGAQDWREGLDHLRTFVASYGVTQITCHARDGLTKMFNMRPLATLYVIED